MEVLPSLTQTVPATLRRDWDPSVVNGTVFATS
jgi:hypothetical protein